MVELQTPLLDGVFHALGDATRRQMLHDLGGGERTVGQHLRTIYTKLDVTSRVGATRYAIAHNLA